MTLIYSESDESVKISGFFTCSNYKNMMDSNLDQSSKAANYWNLAYPIKNDIVIPH